MEMEMEMKMQKQEVKEVKLLRVKPKVIGNVVSVEVNVVKKTVDFSNDDLSMLDFYYEHTECDCIDIVSFGNLYEENSFCVTVDDEGLLKSGNVVMQYTLPIENEDISLQLAGSILIGKSRYVEGRDEDGLYEVGLTDKEIDYITNNLSYKVLGVTR